jgi:hypothetical protein
MQRVAEGTVHGQFEPLGAVGRLEQGVLPVLGEHDEAQLTHGATISARRGIRAEHTPRRRADYFSLMSLRWYTVVIDCQDNASQARWWADVLGWTVVHEALDEVVIVPPHALTKVDAVPLAERGPGLVFVPVPEGKTVKNRLHLDLAPGPDDDQEAEVQRLVDKGATRIDVGQRADVSWVVLADPEGNEFCVLSPRG